VEEGFSRAFFLGELKCVDEQHLAWLVVPLGTVGILMAITFSSNIEICMKFKKRLFSDLCLLHF